jgi:hypothetical protein
VTIGAQPTTAGLHLPVYSTGIKMLGEGEWKTKKHGADYRRQWRKIHLGNRCDYSGNPGYRSNRLDFPSSPDKF